MIATVYSFIFVSVAHAAGMIEDAPRLSSVLTNVFNFLLSIFGVLGIIALVIAGVAYLAAGGDERRVFSAKRAFQYILIGLVIGLGALVIVRQIASFF